MADELVHHKEHMTIKVKQLQQCDFCKTPAKYDGKTTMGPWAFMCQEHWNQHGPGHTGLGLGQELILEGE